MTAPVTGYQVVKTMGRFVITLTVHTERDTWMRVFPRPFVSRSLAFEKAHKLQRDLKEMIEDGWVDFDKGDFDDRQWFPFTDC